MSDGERGPLDFPEGDDPRRHEPQIPEPDRLETHPRGEFRDGGASSSNRYVALVGLVAIAILIYVTINTFTTHHNSSTGVKVGAPLPAFATPLALSDLHGDADVAQHANSGQAGKIAACDLRGPKILNICQLAERGPVVLAFLATRGGRCSDALDRLARLVRGYPGVQLAAISIKGSRGDLRDIVRSHGWRFPVGTDDDGAIANFYGVSICPQVTFASVGGIVQSTSLGDEGESGLRRRLDTVVRISRSQGWTPTS